MVACGHLLRQRTDVPPARSPLSNDEAGGRVTETAIGKRDRVAGRGR